MHVSHNSLRDSCFASSAAVQAWPRNFIGRRWTFLTRATSHDWQLSLCLSLSPSLSLSLSLSFGLAERSLKLTSARSIYPRGGEKGPRKKACFYWTSVAPATVTYCAAYKAFPAGERNASFFHHRHDYIRGTGRECRSSWKFGL